VPFGNALVSNEHAYGEALSLVTVVATFAELMRMKSTLVTEPPALVSFAVAVQVAVLLSELFTVRLTFGGVLVVVPPPVEPPRLTVIFASPVLPLLSVATARSWQAQGAPRLHVVDLDGAFAGGPAQTDLVRAMIRAVSIPVEVGGGLRELAHVEALLEAGARWAIVGTRAALDPGFLGEVCERFGERLMIGIDASEGRVAVDGWTRVLDLDAMALARDAAAAGAAGIIYTDIARDGTQGGPNLWSTEAVARAAGIPVLASGGVGSLDDIRRLATVPGLAGVIVGRALYSGAVDLAAAVAEIR